MDRPQGWRDLELVCPACRGGLGEEPDAAAEPRLICGSCGAEYPVILDIPDLRTRPDPYISIEDDRAKGRRLARTCQDLDFADALPVYYAHTSVVTEEQAKAFTASVMAAGGRAAETLAVVEAERGVPDGALLDLGCGTAPLALDAAARYPAVVGIDVAFRWLVMAKIRLRSAGVRLPLICGCAESLPFPDGSFARVVGESVIELVYDQELALRESARVMAPGADLYLTTPNRFSLGPDPHVGIPAGGYLPDRWIAAYIRRRGGVPPRRRLLADGTLRTLLAGAGFGDIEIRVPRLSDDRVASLSGPLKWAAAAYQGALGIPPLRFLLRKIGPLLSARAVKPVDGATS